MEVLTALQKLPIEVVALINLFLLPIKKFRDDGMVHSFVRYTWGIPIRGVVFKGGYIWEAGVADGVFVNYDGLINDPLLVSREFPYHCVPFLNRRGVMRFFVY